MKFIYGVKLFKCTWTFTSGANSILFHFDGIVKVIIWFQKRHESFWKKNIHKKIFYSLTDFFFAMTMKVILYTIIHAHGHLSHIFMILKCLMVPLNFELYTSSNRFLLFMKTCKIGYKIQYILYIVQDIKKWMIGRATI